MSIIVASGQTISNNLQNTSKSKQMFSFPKQRRFHELKKCTSATFLYDIPDKMSKRKAYIGYGMKSDFTRGRDYNTPHYNVARLFDGPHPDAPKYTFGIARDYYKRVVVGNDISNPEKIAPGPGKYSYLKPFGSQSPKYTMMKRYPFQGYNSSVNTPGPAKYVNNITINPEGKYTLSKYANTRRAGWSLSKIERFKYDYPQTPGANAYKMEEMINGKGKVYNSRFHSPNAKTISMKFKSSFDTDSITPGPGAYQTFSEFGIYRSKHADDFTKTASKTFYKAASRAGADAPAKDKEHDNDKEDKHDI